MRTAPAALALLVGLAAAGCGGGPTIAPVSGKVTLDGKPYRDAVVSFQPVGSKDSPNPGRGSAGVTNDKGEFTLLYDGQKNGAVVGPHRVRIFTRVPVEAPPEDTKSESVPGKGPGKYREPIPPEWNEMSEKTFDVPSGGTDKASFEIVTAASKK